MTTATAIAIIVSVLLGLGAALEKYHRLKRQQETIDRLNQFLDEKDGISSKNDLDIPDDFNNDIFIK